MPYDRWAALTTILLATAAYGCGGGEAGGTAGSWVARDSAGITIVENRVEDVELVCPVSAEPGLSIGEAGGDPAYELYRVFGATRLNDGRVALVNQGSGELRYYDERGRFLRAAGRAGEGPGEFRNAFYLSRLPGDTIWVGDYRPWRFLVFSPEGEWVRTVTPEPRYPNPPSHWAVLADGRHVLGSQERDYGSPRFQPVDVHLVLHDSDGATLDTIGTSPHGSWGQTTTDRGSPFLFPLFESFTRFASTGEGIALGHGSVPEVRLSDPDGTVRRIVRWEEPDRAVTEADVEAEKDALRERYADMDPAMAERMLAPMVHEDRPVAERFPALIDIHVGTDGRVWVERYPRPRGDGLRKWLVFDREGRFLCHVSMPEGLSEYELGPDYVLGETRDELGVERVVVHALGPPEPPPPAAGG